MSENFTSAVQRGDVVTLTGRALEIKEGNVIIIKCTELPKVVEKNNRFKCGDQVLTKRAEEGCRLGKIKSYSFANDNVSADKFFVEFDDKIDVWYYRNELVLATDAQVSKWKQEKEEKDKQLKIKTFAISTKEFTTTEIVSMATKDLTAEELVSLATQLIDKAASKK